jgi:hypothetical protein
LLKETYWFTLNTKYTKNANLHKICIVDNYTDNKCTSVIICENLCHLRHLRAFETIPRWPVSTVLNERSGLLQAALRWWRGARLRHCETPSRKREKKRNDVVCWIASGCAFAGDAAHVSVIANPQGEAIQAIIIVILIFWQRLK